VIVGAVPSHKHDMAAVDRARTLGFPELNPAIPDLLIWVQDLNWPVAAAVADLLSGAGAELAPHLRDVFQSGDAEWTANVLEHVCRQLPPHALQSLRNDFARIASDPTEAEREEGADTAARAVLSRMDASE